MDRRQFVTYGFAGLGAAFCPPLTVTASGCAGDKNSFSCEALFYDVQPNGYACGLCPNKCIVTETRPGNCRTRYVKNEKLVCIAYGNPYYVNTQVPEQLPLFHFRPGEKTLLIGTAGCNLGCLYCNVSEISQASPADLYHHALFPSEVIETCMKEGIRNIAYGYTEPVVFFEYMLETAKLARAKGISNIFCSNGHINEKPLRWLGSYLDAAIIDVKAFNEATYLKLTGGSVIPPLNTVKMLHEMKVWLEVSHLLVPGWTDHADLMGKMFAWMKENGMENVPFHLNRFEPHYRMKDLKPTPEESLSRARKLAMGKGLKYVYLDLPDRQESLTTWCPHCGKPIYERNLNGPVRSGIKNGCCESCGEKIPGIWT